MSEVKAATPRPGGPLTEPHEHQPARLEMKVEHKVQVTEHHYLVGACPKCGKEMSTDDTNAIVAFEAGKPSRSQCECGALLTVPGRSKIITNPSRVVVPGKPNNRHARRARR